MPKTRVLMVMIGAVVIGAFVACSKPDPLIGTWNLSQGTFITFHRGGTVEGGPSGKPASWTGKWERKGPELKLEGSNDPLLRKAQTYSVLKTADEELILRAVESGELVLGARAKK